MRGIVISALLIASALIAAGAMLFWWFSPAATLARAQRQWNARTFTDYRMEGHSIFCRYDALIQGEQVAETFDAACSSGISPVSEQFASIQAMLNNRGCGLNDCVCVGRGVMEVQYNPQWGYPERIFFEFSSEHRWRAIEYWQARLQGKANCPYTFEWAMETRVYSLTPLP
jgi:hypothetical protein